MTLLNLVKYLKSGQISNILNLVKYPVKCPDKSLATVLGLDGKSRQGKLPKRVWPQIENCNICAYLAKIRCPEQNSEKTLNPPHPHFSVWGHTLPKVEQTILVLVEELECVLCELVQL